MVIFGGCEHKIKQQTQHTYREMSPRRHTNENTAPSIESYLLLRRCVVAEGRMMWEDDAFVIVSLLQNPHGLDRARVHPHGLDRARVHPPSGRLVRLVGKIVCLVLTRLDRSSPSPRL